MTAKPAISHVLIIVDSFFSPQNVLRQHLKCGSIHNNITNSRVRFSMKAIILTHKSSHQSLLFVPDTILRSEVELKAYCDQLFPKGWKGWVPATDEEARAGKVLSSMKNESSSKRKPFIHEKQIQLTEEQSEFFQKTGLDIRVLKRRTIEEVEAWWRNEMGEKPKNIMAAMGISRGVLKRMLRNVSRTITDFERWDYELSTGVRGALRVWVCDVDSKLKLQAAIENKELQLDGKDVIYRGKKLSGLGPHAFEELQGFCR